MTNPTLERAATRVAACLMDGPVDPTFSLADVNGWTQDKAYEIARAVLMARAGCTVPEIAAITAWL
jgi:hypothetical protein